MVHQATYNQMLDEVVLLKQEIARLTTHLELRTLAMQDVVHARDEWHRKYDELVADIKAAF